MPGRIRTSDIDEVRARTNVADIIGDYVTLKPAGVGSLKGLCPFHDERSPSFHVRAQLGFYHCFGCGEGGNVFTFLQRMDHISFPEAVERLAARIGFELHYEEGGAPAQEHGNRSRLYAANLAAEEFFREQLATPEAKIGQEFLGARGFDQAAAERFGIGYAPASFDALLGALGGRGFSREELLEAGLLSANDRGRSYDRFRGRLVWPIRDVTGQTIGFGARKLRDDDQGPKYLNTPETPIYHKSQVLYGLDLARRDIAKRKQLVVVEGYTDVMACHLSGVTTAVATCGTAFGVDHVKLARRVLGDVDTGNVADAGEVVFTFDPDEAGQRAASRAFEQEQRFTAQTFVAVAPDGLDPCDLRLHRGEAAVRALLDDRQPMFEFMIRRQLAGHNLETVEGRVAALRATAPVVAGIRDGSLSAGYTRELAGWLGLDPSEVRRAVTAAARQRAKPAANPQGASGAAPEPSTQAEPAARGIASLPSDPSTRLERDAVMALLQQPKLVGPELFAEALEVQFTNHPLSVLRDVLAAQPDAGNDPAGRLARLQELAPEPYRLLLAELSMAPLPERQEHLPVYCRSIVSSLVERELLRRTAETRGALQRAQSEADPARVRELQERLVDLEARRRRVRGE